MDYQTFRVAFKGLGIYSLVLIAVGTIANLICFGVSLRPRLRKTPTFIFLAFNAIMETIALYVFPIKIFLQSFNMKTLEDMNLGWCMAASSLQPFGQYSHAWILVAMVVETCLSVKIKSWRTVYFNSKRAVIVSLVIIILAFASTFYATFGREFQLRVTNTSRSYSCQENYLYSAQKQAEVYLYTVIPFILIAMANAVLIYVVFKELKFHSTDAKKSSKRTALTITIIAKTLAFVAMTLPGKIFSAYYRNSSDYSGFITLYALRLLDLSYNGLNPIPLIIFNKQIFRELKSIIFGSSADNNTKSLFSGAATKK